MFVVGLETQSPTCFAGTANVRSLCKWGLVDNLRVGMCVIISAAICTVPEHLMGRYQFGTFVPSFFPSRGEFTSSIKFS